jgi:Bacterial SH3 domain
MRFAGVSSVVMALLAVRSLAAPGDALVVAGDVVNVRTGPGTGSPVLFHAARDQQVVELAREGEWIQVHVPDQAADGWIHQSLLAVAQPAPAETSAGDRAGSISEALARFRSNLTELNTRALAAAGVELFTGAEPAAGGTVQVMVTETWDLIPEAGQESYTNALFDQWRAVAVGGEELRLQVVDSSGTVVSEKSGPRTP